MRPLTIVAVILIALGIVALAYQGFTYTTRGNTVDLGPLHVTAEQTHNVPLPPIIGGAALLGGIALLLVDRKRLSHVAAR